MALARPTLTFACGRYDRIWPLVDGRVVPEGMDLNLIFLDPEECFFRMLNNAEFDAAEMSLGSYAVLRARGDERFVAIPAFLSRFFRYSMFYLPPGSPILEPKDLEGRRVGVPEYQMTAAVWGRGMLAHAHDVDVRSITWCTGGVEEAGRHERQPLSLPDWVRVEPIPAHRTLSQDLRDGAIDALMAPRVPSVFRDPASGVHRLFPDYARLERAYWEQTGVFPIMHLVVVRSDVLAERPWMALSLYKALATAKDIALRGLADAPALRYTMPFLLPALEEQERLFGPDPWPYGVDANRPVLEEFIRYLVEQGLIERPLGVEDLFAHSTLALSKV